MKTIKMILKGIMLWATLIYTGLWISAIDSIIEVYGYIGFIVSALIFLAMMFVCSKTITWREVGKLTFYKQIDKALGYKSNDKDFKLD